MTIINVSKSGDSNEESLISRENQFIQRINLLKCEYMEVDRILAKELSSRILVLMF